MHTAIELSLSLLLFVYIILHIYIYMQIWMDTYVLLMHFMWCSRRADQLPNQLKSSRSSSRPEMIWPSGRTQHFFEPKNPRSPSEHMPNLVQTCSKTTCSSTNKALEHAVAQGKRWSATEEQQRNNVTPGPSSKVKPSHWPSPSPPGQAS